MSDTVKSSGFLFSIDGRDPNIIEKIRSFASLKKGWQCDYDPISQIAIESAIMWHDCLLDIGACVRFIEVTPSEDGAIIVTTIINGEIIEILLNRDGTITFICISERGEVSYQRGLSAEMVEDLIMNKIMGLD